MESAKVCSKQGRIEDFSQQRLQVFFVVGTARVTVSLHCSHSCKQMHGPTAFSICLVPQWSWDREGRRNGTRQGEQKKKKKTAQEANEMLEKRARISFLQSAPSPAFTSVHRFF